jgi:hypothetical protein
VLALLTTEQREVFIRALARIAWAAAEPTDFAPPSRPLAGGVHPMQQEGRTFAGKLNGAAFQEDGRHEPTDT